MRFLVYFKQVCFLFMVLHLIRPVYLFWDCLFITYNKLNLIDVRLSKEHYKELLAAKLRVEEHAITLRYKKLKVIYETAARARSYLHSKVREVRESNTQSSANAIEGRKSTDSLSEETYDGLPFATPSKQSISGAIFFLPVVFLCWKY